MGASLVSARMLLRGNRGMLSCPGKGKEKGTGSGRPPMQRSKESKLLTKSKSTMGRCTTFERVNEVIE